MSNASAKKHDLRFVKRHAFVFERCQRFKKPLSFIPALYPSFLITFLDAHKDIFVEILVYLLTKF